METHHEGPRPRRRTCPLAAIAAVVFSTPAWAAGPMLAAWGPYLFLALAVTLVVVLLLHEVLEDESSPRESRRDSNLTNSPGERR